MGVAPTRAVRLTMTGSSTRTGGLPISPPPVVDGALAAPDTKVASLRQVLSEGLDGLYRFILVRVGANPIVAEDILQQTAYVALQHDRAPDRPDHQEAWVRGIAKNLVRQHWRLAKRTNGSTSLATVGAANLLLNQM